MLLQCSRPLQPTFLYLWPTAEVAMDTTDNLVNLLTTVRIDLSTFYPCPLCHVFTRKEILHPRVFSLIG